MTDFEAFAKRCEAGDVLADEPALRDIVTEAARHARILARLAGWAQTPTGALSAARVEHYASRMTASREAWSLAEARAAVAGAAVAIPKAIDDAKASVRAMLEGTS